MKKIIYFIFIFMPGLFLTSCSGGAISEIVSQVMDNFQIAVIPTEALVLKADRKVEVADEYVTIEAPNTQLQIVLDNTGSEYPVTIVQATLTVVGPKGTNYLTLDPIQNMFEFDPSTGGMSYIQRPFIGEVEAMQQARCMHKVNYFGASSTSVLCQDIADNPSSYAEGTSAENTTEGSDTSVCCPINAINNLQNTWFLVGPLQNLTQEELNQDGNNFYSFQLKLVGWIGSITNPIANFQTSIYFNSSSL